MNNKKILVLLKYYKGELNPFDASSLECALLSGSNDVTVMAMAPISVLETFSSLTRLGVKGVLISDNLYANSDTLATSLVLSKAIEKISPDYIFCGRQSVDGDTGQVPPQLAERLGYNLVTKAMDLKDGVITTRDNEQIKLVDKSVITFEKSFNLRFPSIFSKLGYVEVWDNSVLQLDDNLCGTGGSPTQVIKAYESTIGRRFCKFVNFDELDSIIKQGLKTQKQEKDEQGEKTERVYFIGNALKQAKTICDNPIEISVKDKTPLQVANQIKENSAKIVLFADDEQTKTLASRVAVILNTGLCADCTSLRIENGKFIMTRPALGGNVTADIVCKNDIALATVRTTAKKSAEIVFGVGYGAIGYIEEIQKLATFYNAEICSSRKVVDQGKFPYEKQVGLTGRTIAPKVYVAFGISGAVQHTCAIEGASTIIAINCDKQARIFDYADYGIIKKL